MRVADRPYEAYEGQRIAEISGNEQRAYDLAASAAGGWKPYIDQANAALGRAGQTFDQANLDAYMNPYIKGALDPAAREIREQGALRINELQGTQAMRGSFGGARATLQETEAQNAIDQTLADHYGQGYFQAFEGAANRWDRDRMAAFEQARGYQTQASLFKDATTADINDLMRTGAMDRSIRQAMADFDYQQWTEKQNWDVKNLSALIAAIQGTHGSYSTTRTTKTKQSSNGVSEVMGLAAMVGGAMIGGPMGAAAGAAAFGGSAGGAPVPMSGPIGPSTAAVGGGALPGEWMPSVAPIPSAGAWGG